MGKIFDMKASGSSGQLVAAKEPMVRRRRRRHWTLGEKTAIVEEAQSSGDPVAVVARRHDMNANHLFNWIDQARAGTLGGRRAARTEKRDAGPCGEPEEKVEQDFIDLGVFTREQMADALGMGCMLEVELPEGLRIRIPIEVEPELLTRAVRALKAA